jgi:uncharacterized protein YidB (DUF937 family)
MSGFLGRILGQLGNTGESGATGTPPIASILSDAFGSSGGVSGLVSRFDQAGLGEHIRSWIGNGSNLPISAEELERVFPREKVEAWGQAHGLPAQAVLQMLAGVLPHAVDHATPDGTTPDNPDQNAGQNLDFAGIARKVFSGS